MSDRKFQIVDETIIGVLDETLKAEWDRLNAQEAQITEAQKSYEEGMDAFIAAVSNRFVSPEESHDVTVMYRVNDNGEVVAKYCRCPSCQATLNGMTLAETIEVMNRNRLINPDDLNDFRNKAKELDRVDKNGRLLN